MKPFETVLLSTVAIPQQHHDHPQPSFVIAKQIKGRDLEPLSTPNLVHFLLYGCNGLLLRHGLCRIAASQISAGHGPWHFAKLSAGVIL